MKDRPDAADPADIARKLAAAPGLKVPPQAEWILDEDGRIKDMIWPGMTFARKLRNFIGMVSFNMIVTYIPSHFIRQNFLRWVGGSTIGKGSTIFRGTTVFDPEFLTIGNDT
ncbi:MAG: hypothetical protein QOK02_4826, partial [Mycobacterium sp.]|nr:hypothetical protein [Mycobacterium sp.]